jgi:hypothetical protein
VQLLFDRITFDDHTEKQVKFIQGLDTDNCIFLWCNDVYRTNFSNLVREKLGENKYFSYQYQHVSANEQSRNYYKQSFKHFLDTNPEYLNKVKHHFALDYELIKQVKFYGR